MNWFITGYNIQIAKQSLCKQRVTVALEASSPLDHLENIFFDWPLDVSAEALSSRPLTNGSSLMTLPLQCIVFNINPLEGTGLLLQTEYPVLPPKLSHHLQFKPLFLQLRCAFLLMIKKTRGFFTLLQMSKTLT